MKGCMDLGDKRREAGAIFAVFGDDCTVFYQVAVPGEAAFVDVDDMSLLLPAVFDGEKRDVPRVMGAFFSSPFPAGIRMACA